MGLFGRHDYGRDYRGEGRGFGDRLRGAWNRFENRMEGGMHRGYDRGMRGGYDRGMQGGGYDASDFAYRGLDGAWSTARNRGAHDVQWDWRRAGGSPYDQDMAPSSSRGYGRDYGAGRSMGGGYDRERRLPPDGWRLVPGEPSRLPASGPLRPRLERLALKRKRQSHAETQRRRGPPRALCVSASPREIAVAVETSGVEHA